MKVATYFARTFAYLQRFSVAWGNFGLASAIRLFAYCRAEPFPAGVSLPVRRLGREVVFRGKTDKGVMSHFFTPNYRIRDSAGNPVRVIVDAGANIGIETLRFRHFHPHARIVAIEPDSGNFSILQRNTRADGKIELLHGGLWSHKCRLHIIPGESAEGFRAEEASGEPQPGDVEAVSIPSIMESFGLDEIDILKLDIEGAEYQVFTAADVESWIRRVKVLIFECPDADRPGTTQAIFQKLAGLDFVCHIHGECLVLIRTGTGWKLESNTYL
jgi:FkbM family methyltransferase